MPTIDLDQKTFEKITFSASLLDISPSDVVARLVAKSSVAKTVTGPLSTPSSSSLPTSTSQSSGWLGVRKTFKGHEVRGEFNPSTSEVKVSSSPWNGQIFASPTAAAQAVVLYYSGERATPNTNGRKFWKLDDGRGDLRVVVGTRF